MHGVGRNRWTTYPSSSIFHMEVPENGATPKSSILNRIFPHKPEWGIPIDGNPHIPFFKCVSSRSTHRPASLVCVWGWQSYPISSNSRHRSDHTKISLLKSTCWRVAVHIQPSSIMHVLSFSGVLYVFQRFWTLQHALFHNDRFPTVPILHSHRVQAPSLKLNAG